MTPDDRRAALIEVTLPLLLEHGRAVTTKQIAAAAGVAEGTIFRVFASKDDLIDQATHTVLDQNVFLEDLGTIPTDQGLRPLLVEITSRLQIRYKGVFALMTALGVKGPPGGKRGRPPASNQFEERVVGLIAPYAGELRCRPDQLVLQLRLLTFGGTHPHFSGGRTLTPDAIVSTLLDGLLKHPPSPARKDSAC